jgi:hypothetical protein
VRGKCRLLYLLRQAITMNAANKWSNIYEESDIKKHYLILLLSANRNLILPSIHKALNYLAFQILILSVPDEGYSRNATCAHNLISSFLLTIKTIVQSTFYFPQECQIHSDVNVLNSYRSNIFVFSDVHGYSIASKNIDNGILI